MDKNSAQEASKIAQGLADAHMAGFDNLYRYVAWAEQNERRLKALRVHLDCEGKAEFCVWANEMIELDGLWSDEDESIPAMYDTLDDLLDVLYEVVSTPAEKTDVPGTTLSDSDAPNGAAE